MRDTELRLALVCYGGISLAVYMHGITREVWHLARASRAFNAGEAAEGATEAVYRNLLEEMEDRSGARLRVLPDIIAGASAGGINGIFLGQAIATGQSLDPLTDLWLASADIEALVAAEAAPASRFSKAWAMPLAWMAAGRGGDLSGLDEATQAEVRAKLSHFVRSRWFEPPFSGEALLTLLLDAFDVMASGPRGPRLLPPSQPLDLFVTVTDFTGHPERLLLNSPAEVVETEHRIVIDFTDGGHSATTLAHPAELAFAARATSSFPGAFPPFRVGELDAVLQARGVGWPGRRAFLRRVLPRQTAVGKAEEAAMIDGSVLANAPFGPAIDALKDRPARRPVDRRFVFIDPSPGMKFRLGGSGATPGFFQTILGAISELPRQQPIRDNLEAIGVRSARVARMRGIVAAIRPDVEVEIEQLFGRTLFLDRPTPRRLPAWRRRAHDRAVAQSGFGHAAYGQLKLVHVLEGIARLLRAPGDRGGGSRAGELRAEVDRIAAERGWLDVGTGRKAGAATVDFLRRYDLGYRIRRLRLLARRISDLEGDGGAADALGPMHAAVYAALADYIDRQNTREPAPHRLRGQAGKDVGQRIDRLGELLDLSRLDAETDMRLSEALAAIDRVPRRSLLMTYLGFPFFDIATLPLLQGEGLDEFDPVRVDRIAPDDATAIRTGGAEATLKGIRFNSFGAFFSRAYRENDYLWGRLHGADRLIDIAVSTLPDTIRMKLGRVSAIKRAAFLAILDEERDRLTAIPALFEDLRREIG
ncbi:patatin-related protein [Sphingomonas gellani]|uniref:Patatin-related protein n=1 Tax=Sphingomonas gellani TaxID=1166340 RepID=A0A1H8EJ13_9SPHN|nr:patatin-like protein [Sphingomonas gellani]SEN19124.1 patatin-related protein [Sphingomonas gellani]